MPANKHPASLTPIGTQIILRNLQRLRQLNNHDETSDASNDPCTSLESEGCPYPEAAEKLPRCPVPVTSAENRRAQNW